MPTRLSNEVQKILERSARALIQLRTQKRKFVDNFQDKQFENKKTFLATCEGLEGIFLAVLAQRDNTLAGFVLDRPQRNFIEEDVQFLVSQVEKNDYKVFPGGPYYWDVGRKSPIVERNNTDSLAFFLSVLCHIYAIMEKMKEDSFAGYSLEDLRLKISRCTTFLSTSLVDNKGWPFELGSNGSVGNPDNYSTWSVLEAIGELQVYYPQGLGPLMLPQKQSCLDSVKMWLEEQISNGLRSECQKYIESLKIGVDYNTEAMKAKARPFYDGVHTIAGLSILGSQRKHDVGLFVSYLINQIDRIVSIEFKTRYRESKADDYTLVPMLLRCLSGIFEIYCVHNSDGIFEKAVGRIENQRDSVLHDLYSHILKRKLHFDQSGNFDGLFSDTGEERMVDIYYTERVIESLSSYLSYLTSTEVRHISEELKPLNIHISSKRITPSKPQQMVKRTPRTIRKLPKHKVKEEKVQETLPALTQYAYSLVDRYGIQFKKSAILIVQHFLSDLLPFIGALKILEAVPKNIFCVRKTYGYPEGDDVERSLRKLGVNVYKSTGKTEKEKEQERIIILKQVINHCKNKPKKERLDLLIVEDGGYFVPILHQKYFKKLIPICVGSVEQTTRGVIRDRSIPRLRIPVYDVATSELKRTIEGPEVAETLAENLRHICGHSKVNWRLNLTRFMILGGGTIGSLVAERLARMNAKEVAVYDRSSKVRASLRRKWKRLRDGPFVLERIEDDTVERAKVIFGVSTSRTIDRDIIFACRHNAILASGSSERYEIDLTALEQFTKRPPGKHIKRHRNFPLTDYVCTNGKTVRVLCDGEPINFALSSGIPKPAIEPVLMQMLWSAVRLISLRGKLKPRFIKFPKQEEREILRLTENIQKA